MLIAANGSREIARACALLSERHFIPARSASTTSDLLSAIDDWRERAGARARRRAARSRRLRAARASSRARYRRRFIPASGAESTVNSGAFVRAAGVSEVSDDAAFRKAILAGYPDRVAQRREPGSPRVRLASGAGAVVGPESGVRDGEFLVAIDVQSGSHGRPARASRKAGRRRRTTPASASPAASSANGCMPTHSELVHRFDRASGLVRAWTVIATTR